MLISKHQFYLIWMIAIILLMGIGTCNVAKADSGINPKEDLTLPSLAKVPVKGTTYTYYFHKENMSDREQDLKDCWAGILEDIAKFGYADSPYDCSVGGDEIISYFSSAMLLFNQCMERKGYVRKVHINKDHYDILGSEKER